MRNDRHKPTRTKQQRPERIPIDPEHSSYSRNATAAVAIDSLLQDSRRLEHDYATRRDRHLGAGFRIAADPLTFACVAVVLIFVALVVLVVVIVWWALSTLLSLIPGIPPAVITVQPDPNGEP